MKRVNCETCGGRGEDGHRQPCADCDGSGKDPAIVGYAGAEWD